MCRQSLLDARMWSSKADGTNADMREGAQGAQAGLHGLLDQLVRLQGAGVDLALAGLHVGQVLLEPLLVPSLRRARALWFSNFAMRRQAHAWWRFTGLVGRTCAA